MTGRVLRVVHISTVHGDTDTRIFEKQCRGLAALGHEVALVIPSAASSMRQGVDVRALPPSRGRLGRMTLSVFHAFRLARKTPADIYHLHDPELLPLGVVLSAMGKRVIYDMHENLPHQIRMKYWIPRRLRRPVASIVALLERLTLNRMAVVMAEDSYAADYSWVDRSIVIRNFPLVEELSRIGSARHDVPTLGYIGDVTRNRGALTMILAVQRLRDRGAAIEFECVGNVASDVAGHPAFGRALEEGWLRAPGRLPPGEGWRRMAACHAGAAVLKPVNNYIGSFPTKMFEYMAMGLPVIVSDFPLYREVVDRHDCGICMDPESVEAITDALSYLLENPLRALEMGKNGRRAVRSEYNWSGELARLTGFYLDEPWAGRSRMEPDVSGRERDGLT